MKHSAENLKTWARNENRRHGLLAITYLCARALLKKGVLVRMKEVHACERKFELSLGRCSECGKVTSDVVCVSCKYRSNGGEMNETEQFPDDCVRHMARHEGLRISQGFWLSSNYQH